MFGGTNERYIHKNFKTTEGFGKSGASDASSLYKQIVDYANKHKYKIVNISKIEEGHFSTLGINVIFENEK